MYLCWWDYILTRIMKQRFQQGSSLISVLLAWALSATIVITVMKVSRHSLQSVVQASLNSQAALLAHNGLVLCQLKSALSPQVYPLWQQDIVNSLPNATAQLDCLELSPQLELSWWYHNQWTLSFNV